MKQTFSDQLSVWRTANGVATMKEVLKENTTFVEKDGKQLKVIRPHAHIKTNNVKVLGAYVNFRIALIKIIGRMRVAIENQDMMEYSLLNEDMSKLTKKFFNALRQATGYENFMAIDHENALSIENGNKVLTIQLFPMQADSKTSFDVVGVDFSNKDGDKMTLPCMVIVEPKRKRNRKRGKKVNKQ